MSKKRTHASVTSDPCECGYLQDSAANPDCPITFDEKTEEFQFVYMEEGSEGQSMLVIYHCPFCGGTAPESKRDQLFEAIPRAEEERLADILNPVRTMDDAIIILGEPDWDSYSTSRVFERNGKAPTVHRNRMIQYHGLSEIAEVFITEANDGSVHCQLQGKTRHL